MAAFMGRNWRIAAAFESHLLVVAPFFAREHPSLREGRFPAERHPM